MVRSGLDLGWLMSYLCEFLSGKVVSMESDLHERRVVRFTFPRRFAANMVGRVLKVAK